MFNGVFGHKPSAGYVPATGHFPVRAGRSSMMSVIGPICRCEAGVSRPRQGHGRRRARSHLTDGLCGAEGGARAHTVPTRHRYACDMYPIMKVIAGPTGIDTNVRPQMVLQDPNEVNLRDVRVYSWFDDNGRGVTRPVAREVRQVRAGETRAPRESRACNPLNRSRP